MENISWPTRRPDIAKPSFFSLGSHKALDMVHSPQLAALISELATNGCYEGI